MGRQFRFFLLPSDIDSIVASLRLKFDLKIILDKSPTPNPVEVAGPSSEWSVKFGGFEHISCCLVPSNETDIRMRFIPTQAYWLVEDQLELIEFSGCDYDGRTLVEGRFYFQADMLIGDTIWPKRKEFIEWADRIFRHTKKLLIRSKELDAYVGKDAYKWRQEGGHFTHLRPRHPQKPTVM
jgi:hypothetical protein